MTEKFITTTELASILRVPAETVRYWRHADKGPKSFKIGRLVLYAESDVNDWINEQRGSGGSNPLGATRLRAHEERSS